MSCFRSITFLIAVNHDYKLVPEALAVLVNVKLWTCVLSSLDMRRGSNR